MGKNIYFAGSIRGGREDAALYRQIINHLKEQGFTVLTEHVGRPELNLLEQGKDKDNAIYVQDTAWLRKADLLVAECTCPSLGVGYELAFAEKLGIPCHVFYNRKKTQLSAMITGNSYFQVHPYSQEEEIMMLMDEMLKAYRPIL